MSDQTEGALQLDSKGYVTISKGDQEAKIVPESLPVWEDQGWSAKTEQVVAPENDWPVQEDEDKDDTQQLQQEV